MYFELRTAIAQGNTVKIPFQPRDPLFNRFYCCLEESNLDGIYLLNSSTLYMGICLGFTTPVKCLSIRINLLRSQLVKAIGEFIPQYYK